MFAQVAADLLRVGEFKGTLAAKRGDWTSEALEETSPSVVTPSGLQGGRAFSNTWVS